MAPSSLSGGGEWWWEPGCDDTCIVVAMLLTVRWVVNITLLLLYCHPHPCCLDGGIGENGYGSVSYMHTLNVIGSECHGCATSCHGEC